MTKLLLASLLTMMVSSNGWFTNLDEAKATAVKNNQLILINFSGSDWCGPCVRMYKEIFDSEVFKLFANDNLVLLNADFPRQRKNQLSKAQQKENDHLAELYNPEGKFPYTVLITTDGKVLKDWDGYPREGMSGFMEEIKQVVSARN